MATSSSSTAEKQLSIFYRNRFCCWFLTIIAISFLLFNTLLITEHVKCTLNPKLFFATPLPTMAPIECPSSSQVSPHLSAENVAAQVTTKPNKVQIDVTDLKKALPNVTIRTRDIASTSTKGRCQQPSGRRILVNYASHCCQKSQPKNCETGLTVGGFDVCISFNETSLDEEFKQLNKRILSAGTGGGYWLWKPYVVMKTLYAMREDDVLFYADSGTHFIDNMDRAHVCLQEQLGLDIVVFTDGHAEHKMTKPDAFVLMDVDRNDPKMADGNQLIAAFLLLRKTFRSMRFVGQWLGYAQDYRIISNDASTFGQNPSDFRGHRNDQSVLSLLRKKWNIDIWPDPSQWGEYVPSKPLREQPRFALVNRTFISHTRDKS